jgi:hypothetical protein
MKRIILAAVLIVFTFNAMAQVSHDDLTIIQSAYSKKKSDLVKDVMKLNAAQSKAFWPVYDKYEAKRVALSNQRVAVINEYLKNYDALNDQKATDLINRVFANDKSFNDLEKTFYPNFASAVGAKNAAKFYQLENYLKLIVRLSVQDNIPFIGELDKSKH